MQMIISHLVISDIIVQLTHLQITNNLRICSR